MKMEITVDKTGLLMKRSNFIDQQFCFALEETCVDVKRKLGWCALTSVYSCPGIFFFAM